MTAFMSLKLERWVGAYLPPRLARLVRCVGVYPRYWIQAQACRAGYKKFGHLYPQKVLFVAGLPKSGTTWLEKMLSTYPGFHELLIPEQTIYDLRTGGAHDYELPTDMFSLFKNMLVVTKMHVHGSLHNAEVLRKAGVKYVVLYRDLRDVAVSAVFYVRRSRWHPEYPHYAKISVESGLKLFAQRTLSAYAEWVRSWRANRDPEMSLELRYEEMISDPFTTMTDVARHFQLDNSPRRIREIVDSLQFQRLSSGRLPGQENRDSFFRKGVAGDWKNYFTPELKEIYKSIIGDFLVEFGYEQGYSW